MQTMSDFLKKHPVSIEIRSSFDNPNMENDPKYPMDHWQCRLTYSTRSMVVYFSKGLGLREGHKSGPSDYVGRPVVPTVREVLDCLASDASGVDQKFESWAGDFGYDSDSRKAEKIFREVKRQSKNLEALLGPDVYQELLCETERD